MALEPAAEVDPDALCWRRDSWRCLIWGTTWTPWLPGTGRSRTPSDAPQLSD